MDFERDSPVGSSMFTLNPFGLIISKNVAGKQYLSRKEMAFSSVSSSSSSPCAACKFLRRKCTVECVFAPYFSPEQPHKFASVHKIFGASNISKLLNELPSHQREDAVTSLAYEAEARVKDPVYGCVGAISVLQGQVQQLQRELAEARADLARYTALEMRMQGNHGVPVHRSSHRLLESRRERVLELARVQGSGGPCSEALGVAAGIYYNITPSSPTSLPTHPPPACNAPHTGWCEFMSRKTHYDEYEGFY